MPDDPLYHSIIESTHVLTNVLTRLDTTQRMGVRLQGLALGLLLVAVVGIGGLLVFASLEHRDHAALVEALRVETKALSILLERMPTR